MSTTTTTKIATSKRPIVATSLSNSDKAPSQDELTSDFRQFLPDLSQPRFTTLAQLDPYSYTEHFRKTQQPQWFYNLTETWEELYKEPYVGITNDGDIRKDLFHPQDEDVPIQAIVEAVDNVLVQLSPEQKEKLSFPINAKEWRAWSNPEVLLRPFGLRLDEVSEPITQSILRVVKATFSEKGYEKARDAMRINEFLGELCCVPKIMNKYSYNFLLFGTPSTESSKPWGWSFYGHHLCLNVFLKGKQIIISPTFTGAEPDKIDQGEFRGTSILHREGDLGLKLMQSLPPHKQKKAQIYELMHDPDMLQTGNLIQDRWNEDDQRHLCGAFRDNRVVLYEGILASEMTDGQKSLILDIADEFLLYLPDTAREIRKKRIAEFWHETYFSWIGGYGQDDPFYYRIQSPVIILEFDHHSGVYLTNKEPAKFHIHTIVRTPNAGDYGAALRSPAEVI